MIPIPPALEPRPRDRRGLPLAVTLGINGDGVAMQGTNDPVKVARCILDRLCGLCGGQLGYWVAFIGDEGCVAQRIFVEPPMHEDCARYALQVCPYLAGQEGFEVKRQRPGVVAYQDRSRPARMALVIVRQFEPFPAPHPPYVPASKTGAPKTVEWF